MGLSFEEQFGVFRVAVENMHDSVVSADDESFGKRHDAFDPETIAG